MVIRNRIGQPAAPAIVGPPSVAVPRIPGTLPQPAIVDQERAREVARSRAFGESLIHRSQNTSFEAFGEVRNPTAAAGVLAFFNLVSFTVPQGQVFRVNKLSVDYSNPVYAQTRSVGWRVTVDDGRLPNFFAQFAGGFPLDFFSLPTGNVGEPIEIDPVYAQSSQVVALTIVANGAGDQHLVLSGRMSGRIYRPANPELIPGEAV